MVITRGRLDELVPIENAAMPDRTVIEWNKDDLDELGILKVDCLALGMLTAIRRCFDLVQRHYGRRLTLANIPEGDEDVYAMIRRADTMGVFQIESRAQMSMLPRLQPRCFYDLVIEVAIVRPGPIQGNMVHPYLRRRSGEEPVTYPNDAVRGVLEKTLGVPLFQEQAMRLAVVAAGFTPGEADQLRRAMGAWRRPGVIDQFRQKLMDGMRANGFSEQYAEAVFGQIRGFGDYGFPESHAASFALLVYVSAWLKCHYPAAFTAALLNSQPMGFYAPAQLVRNAAQHGVEVLPVDVNASDWDCTLEKSRQWAVGSGQSAVGSGQSADNARRSVVEPTNVKRLTPIQNPGDDFSTADCRLPTFPSPLPTADCRLPTADFSLRLGFNILSGVPSSDVERIVEARRQGPFISVDDFARRTGLSRAAIARLAKAGTFGSLELNRRAALWEALGQDQKELPLFDTKKRLFQSPNLQIFKSSNPLAPHVACRRGSGRLPSRRAVVAGASALIPAGGIGQAKRCGGARVRNAPRRQARHRGGHRAGASAAWHRQGHHLCHSGRRNRHGQPDCPAGGVETMSPGGHRGNRAVGARSIATPRAGHSRVGDPIGGFVALVGETRLAIA